jgi:phenylalanyl-tRNA synthetase beta chain
MRVPLSWLKEFVDINISPAELAFRLTVAGAEVSKIEYVGVAPGGPNTFGVSADAGLAWERAKILVAQIVEVLPHPNADRLVLADVDFGANPGSAPGRGELHRVVTGAPNIFHLKGQGRLADGPKVVFAREGSQLYDGHAEGQKLMTLKPSKIRGVPSNAMVCSEKELGLSEEHEGIIILDADAPVGMPLADYMGDVVLHIEILPNIARCQSIIGVAREVAALTGAQFKGTDQGKLHSSEAAARVVETSDWVKLHIDAPDLCARYSVALIRAVHIGPSPEWMQRRLRLVGVRAINNVVDITNYVMMEWGQPLHAFDYDKLVRRNDSGVAHPRAEGVSPSAGGRNDSGVAHRRASDLKPSAGGPARPHPLPPSPNMGEGEPPTIIIRRALAGEHLTTLDGADRTLSPEMLMIADSVGSIGLAGVMGGAETEIDEHTTSVLLEAAAFNFINNRKTASALKLPSEATARFGRGVPPAHTLPTSERACELMRQLSWGEVAPEVVDAYPGRQPPTVIAFDTAEIKRLLGIDVRVERITAILQSLDFAVRPMGSAATRSNPILEITAPEHRLDVTIAADIVEEVARIIGYDQIPPTLMRDELPPQRRNHALEAEDRIRDIMVGCGLQEVISYPLTTIEREALLAPDPSQADLDPTSYVTIANPISPERKVMRHTLLSSLLDTLREALRHRERVMLFEIGRVYLPQSESTLPAEHTRLTIALAGPREPQSWLRGKNSPPLDFFDIKGIVDTLAASLNLKMVQYAPSEHPSFHPARSAFLSGGSKPMGVFGEVHPEVREHFDLPRDPVCLAEFDLEALQAETSIARFKKLPRFPAIREDIAVVVDEEVPAAQIEAIIGEAGGTVLRSLTLFDLYRGDQVGAGKKSLAYALTFQHDERTLTDDEAAKIRGRIVKKLRDAAGAELRG